MQHSRARFRTGQSMSTSGLKPGQTDWVVQGGWSLHRKFVSDFHRQMGQMFATALVEMLLPEITTAEVGLLDSDPQEWRRGNAIGLSANENTPPHTGCAIKKQHLHPEPFYSARARVAIVMCSFT